MRDMKSAARKKATTKYLAFSSVQPTVSVVSGDILSCLAQVVLLQLSAAQLVPEAGGSRAARTELPPAQL